MKSLQGSAGAPAIDEAATIVRLADVPASDDALQARSEAGDAQGRAVLQRARAFAEPLLDGAQLDTGEDALAHADGVAGVLRAIGAAPSIQAAAYLVYAADYLQRPEEVLAKAFGASYAGLATHTRKLVQAQRAARGAQLAGEQRELQTERVRKMLLAFSRDLRVVLLRLASRLQTMRWHAAERRPCPRPLAEETQQVFAPLANRLGIWQIKWELEDLSFRFLEPDEYQRVARLLDGKRIEREAAVEQFRCQLADELHEAGIEAEVQGRPKHLYSIWKKMRGKGLDFARVFDVRALRVIVADVPTCYAALAQLQQRYRQVPGEFDDYIARPKGNGYQSLHSVLLDDADRAVEVQIRTRQMHEHAEFGVAAHWAYKEAGTKGYAGVVAAGDDEARVAEARKAVLRQLLAWEREFVDQPQGEASGAGAGHDDGRIYVFTPQATLIELPQGATPVDFAYALHTEVGHRCRGAKVDGAMLPLTTRLASGQTVEIITAKEGGPSLDWLNPEQGYLAGSRAKAKVRAWFNALAQAQTIARGRDAVDKLLQREGRTALKLDELAARLGFRNADALFEVVGKDEYSLRNIEQLLRPPAPPAEEMPPLLRKPVAGAGAPARGGVLVVGVDSLLTTLARCCRPAPPDAIGGFVTRGHGVAVHRAECVNFRHMCLQQPERVIEVAWGEAAGGASAVYPVDVLIEALDRGGLLRDISEVFAKEKMNVIGVHTQSVRGSRGPTAWMTFTVEAGSALRIAQVLTELRRVPNVRHARRK